MHFCCLSWLKPGPDSTLTQISILSHNLATTPWRKWSIKAGPEPRNTYSHSSQPKLTEMDTPPLRTVDGWQCTYSPLYLLYSERRYYIISGCRDHPHIRCGKYALIFRLSLNLYNFMILEYYFYTKKCLILILNNTYISYNVLFYCITYFN